MDFRKDFDTVPRNNLWNKLEELKVPLKLRAATIRLYENVIAKFKRKILSVISELNKVSPSPLPYLAFTSIS